MKIWIYLAFCCLVVGIYCADEDENKDEDEDEQPKRLVVYYNFEKGMAKNHIADKSGYENIGDLSDGGEILKFADPSYTCNQGARLWDSEIKIRGDTFQAKPKTAVTIAAWVRLDKIAGQHSIFDTMASDSLLGQYHFEVNNGIVRWFHRDTDNEKNKVIFESMAHTVEKGKWTHVAGTYDSKTKQAKIFINGEIRNQSIGDGMLSRNWGKRAGVSNMEKCRPLQGSIDEFRIYNYALTPDEIKALVSACKSPDATDPKPASTDAASPNAEAESDNGANASARTSDTGSSTKSDDNNNQASKRKRRSIFSKLFH